MKLGISFNIILNDNQRSAVNFLICHGFHTGEEC